MIFVGTFRVDRARDEEFWAVLWHGDAPPADLRLIAAYNLLTDERLLVFEADSIASIRWLDRFNFVGRFTSQPALDQTAGYQAALRRDLPAFESFLRERGLPEPAVKAAAANRRQAMEATSLRDALQCARERQL